MLWTDVIDPATLTGYARAALEDFEQSRGTLARWLPNRMVPDVVARFLAGATGLVEVARFRAYDAELEIGERPSGKRVTLELPALGTTLPVTEYEQLRARGGNISDAQALLSIQTVARQAVQATSDAIERLRGTVIATGKATINQDNFKSDDDFGRPGGNSITAAALWTTTGADRLAHLEGAQDVYVDVNGENPGTMLMSTRAFRALANGSALSTQLGNGASRRATAQQIQDTVSGAGLPTIELYDRRVKVGGSTVRALPDDTVYFLPPAVDPDDFEGTDLGATFWGRTLTSTDPDWDIEDEEQPGIVAGVYRNPKPPMGIEVIGDAIGLPVLANAERSLALKVL